MGFLLMATMNLESIWNYDDPAGSEKKFRELLAQTSDPNDALEIQTQIARAQGLQRKFDDAHRTLDAVEPARTNSPRIEIRYLLERGRTLNSSGQPDKSKPLFLDAWEKAQAARLDFFAVDAAHMLGIVEPPDEALKWNEKAVGLAEKSSDPKAQGWIGSLLNNIGWTYYDKGDYAKALDVFQRDLKWFEERKREEQARIARYSIGKTYRAMGRVEEALALQQKLKPDGFVLEEIAECLLALKRTDEAKPYFARADESLSKDEWLAANEPQRLQRLRDLSR